MKQYSNITVTRQHDVGSTDMHRIYSIKGRDDLRYERFYIREGVEYIGTIRDWYFFNHYVDDGINVMFTQPTNIIGWQPCIVRQISYRDLLARIFNADIIVSRLSRALKLYHRLNETLNIDIHVCSFSHVADNPITGDILNADSGLVELDGETERTFKNIISHVVDGVEFKIALDLRSDSYGGIGRIVIFVNLDNLPDGGLEKVVKPFVRTPYIVNSPDEWSRVYDNIIAGIARQITYRRDEELLWLNSGIVTFLTSTRYVGYCVTTETIDSVMKVITEVASDIKHLNVCNGFSDFKIDLEECRKALTKEIPEINKCQSPCF